MIRVTDISDHSVIYLKIHLNSKRKTTLWRINKGIINNKGLIGDVKEEIDWYGEENDNGEVDPLILWYALKAVIQGEIKYIYSASEYINIYYI